MNLVLQGTPDSILKTFWVKSKNIFGCIFGKSKKNILHILLKKKIKQKLLYIFSLVCLYIFLRVFF